MLSYQSGAAEAFEALYSRWRIKLFRYLAHQCESRQIAEELYHDVWLKVIAARTQYHPSAKFSTWLYRVAHNRLVDHWRSCGREFSLDDEAPSASEGCTVALHEPASPPAEYPERVLERKQITERMVSAIARLPEAQREVFLLSHEGDLTLEEIASATGTNRETAKSRLRYALGKLRADLETCR